MNNATPISQVLLQCPRCSEKHPAYYQEFKNATRHLGVLHYDCIVHIPYQAGLDIPTIPTGKALGLKSKLARKQRFIDSGIPLF